MSSPFETPAMNQMGKDEALLIADIFHLYRSAWDFAQPFFDEAEELYYAYDAYIDPNSHTYKYNPVVPLVFTLEEDIVSTIINAVFERERVFDITPVEVYHQFNPFINDEDIARQLQLVVNLQLQHPDTGFINNFTDFAKQSAHYGNSYSVTLPRFKRDSFDDHLIYLGPKIEPISYFHVLGDPLARNLCDGRFIIQIEHVSRQELKNREKNERYFNTDKVDKDNYIGDDRQDEIFQTLGRLSKYFVAQTSDNKGNIIELLHVYLKGHIITLAGRRVIVRDTRKKTEIGDLGSFAIKPYPYDIWDEFKFYPKPLERYAKGVAHIVAKYQDEISTFKRMRLEEIELDLRKILMMSLGMVDAPIEMFISAPGAIWDVDPNLVKVLDRGANTTQNSYTEQQFNILQAQDSVGSQDISRGQRTPRRQTATTDTILNQNAAKKNLTLMKRLKIYLQSIARKHIMQIHTWMDQADYERILGEPDAGFFNLTIDEIDRMFDINVTSTALDQTRNIEQSAFIQFAQFAAKFPQITNMPELLKDGFKMVLPYKNPDRYILQQQVPPQMAGMPGQGQVPLANPAPNQTPGSQGFENQTASNVISGNFGNNG